MASQKSWYSNQILGFFISISAGSALATFDDSHPPHHFFNAHLLHQGEGQVALSGNVKLGLLEELEVGTQSLLWLPKDTIWNLALKHRMFETDSSVTAFVSHSFYVRQGHSQTFVSMHGIINTRPLGERNFFLSLGLMDMSLLSSNRDADSSLHILTPTLAFDWIISSDLAFALAAAKPTFAIGEQSSLGSGEGRIQIDLNRQQSSLAYGSATLTYSSASWNIEFGLLSFSTVQTNLIPYFNMFWRFHAY